MSGDFKPSHAPDALREQVINVLRTIFDPELPVNIYDLGLIYDVSISDQCNVAVRMTLTSPNCPVAESLPRQVRSRILETPGVQDAEVQVVFDPPWSADRMSEVARFELECMGLDPTRLHGSRLTNLTVGRRTPST
jgi:FeS assembly SUF system protein